MSTDMLDIVRLQIDRLKKACEALRDEHDMHLREAAQCEEEANRNAAKIEALEEVLAAAERVPHDGGESQPEVSSTPLGNGEQKPKATAAIFALVDERGAVTREQILDLENEIDSDADDKRHILQTTVYLLKKRGKLAEDSNGLIRRPSKLAPH